LTVDAALDAATASRWARLALSNIATEFPYKPDHLLTQATDLALPRTLHPIFFGSYDWHSAVHMHWLLTRLVGLLPDLPEEDRIAALFDSAITSANVAGECAYLGRPGSATFERTYGWAWLLKLATELARLAPHHTFAERARVHLAPLAQAFVGRFCDYLPRCDYPVRAGTHANSAFGLLFALDYAHATCEELLARLVQDKARGWFANDAVYPAHYEPGGNDFLSAGLLEALLMSRVLERPAFAAWWQRFEPAPHSLQHWLLPVCVADRADPQIVHLDGLNLSRAWCWSALQENLPERLKEPVGAAIRAHREAALPHLEGHYVGGHWLASFALLAVAG